MSDNCNGCESVNCSSSCTDGNCGSKPQDFIEKTHELNSIKRVIGIVSGKGGVGKSLVTSTLAVMMRRKGYKVGILDADVTGPSIPKMFGITKKAEGSEFGIYPQRTHNDIQVMSVNLLLEKEDAPVIWRGPIIAGTVKQFWTEVIWGEVDYLFLDMPPGTGDVPLTVFQSIPLDGIVIVTSPQDLVSLIVKKAYNMAKAMNIPILGVVENMSYLKCPDCGKEIKLFGESKINVVSKDLGIKVLGSMPVDPDVAELSDNGEIEKVNNEYLMDAIQYIENKLTVI
jgi:Mrp family chromosome partitioning ATPase